MRARCSRAAAAVALLLGGQACGASAPPGPRYPGSVDAPPSMEVLPSLPRRLEAFSERMRFAYLLAEETFDLEPPDAPEAPDAAELREWSDAVLTPWLARKSRMVEAARAELDQAADEDHLQLIVAGALVGLVYEDVARVLLRIPVPVDLWEEPEIARIYREVIAAEARPFLEHARRAYRACALNARRPAWMRDWADFCAGRRDFLPGGAEREAEGTTVEVVRE